MSEQIKHECGIALIRLLKPYQYYIDKYGTPMYGLNKLYLLMEKQHNRGQDGAGVATIKFDVPPGTRYISRYRSTAPTAIKDIFGKINDKFVEANKKYPDKISDAKWVKKHVAFSGELLLGHLRYGTYGANSVENCHPFLRQNNWITRNLVVAGNFNLTNVDELFDQLVELGQHPKEKADTVTVMEKIGHFLDREVDHLFGNYKSKGHSNEQITDLIASNLNIQKILSDAGKKWDGGYTMAGMFGHGDAFVLRDPIGIRPAYWYADEEVVVVTSERPQIQTAFNVPIEKIHELTPGCALIIKKNGEYEEKQVRTPKEKKSCSFERIYFSRGNDKDIYEERKSLGNQLTTAVLNAVDYDMKNTVFSFIPNTAEVAFHGLVNGLHTYLNAVKKEKILALKKIDGSTLAEILNMEPRIEKIALKDAKLRTFISSDSSRDEMVSHIYDTTYGVIQTTDNLVMIDDSIVRGTTLKQSILKILDRLHPKKIIIVSSAPQIRYPDCYGIDMAKLGDFVAFQAAVELLKEQKKENILAEIYEKAKTQDLLPAEQVINVVKGIYKPFTAEEISLKISKLLTPVGINAEVEIIYQTIEGLHNACPGHKGDWYFTGDYPTPGGNKVVNRAFIYYMEGKNFRAY
ncbi:MAG: amidophosphoribosyltransferase [Bacteroidetes bacterium]|nr:amidophosphoribosyltransferase [Bacteroidota bacterium]PHX82881.1 MAG: amidophosphoribosyltransferase [Flavobacteriales bacterium]